MTMPSLFLWLNFSLNVLELLLCSIHGAALSAAKGMYSLMSYNDEGVQAPKDWSMQALSDLAVIVD